MRDEVGFDQPAGPPVSAAARLVRSSPTPGDVRRWTINGDFLALNPTGVARYACEVTRALDSLVFEGHPLAEGLELDIVAPTRGQMASCFRALPVRIVAEFARPRLPQVWVQVQLPRHVPGGLLSFCNLAPVVARPHIVCIHDLQTRLVPESYGRLFRLAHRAILPILGRRATSITTVSELSAQHLAEFGVSRRDKITVTYNGSDHATRWRADLGTLPAPRRPYVLCLGRAEKHKNLELLLRLAPLLESRGLDLWMAGAVDDEIVDAHFSERPGGLRLLGRINDDDFSQALGGAQCFLFPSRSEGFGLPAVEAMATGCPVVSSTSSCLPEICGGAALFADPEDTRPWIDAIERLRCEPGLRDRMVREGLRHSARYNWRQIAKTYLELMLSADRARNASQS